MISTEIVATKIKVMDGVSIRMEDGFSMYIGDKDRKLILGTLSRDRNDIWGFAPCDDFVCLTFAGDLRNAELSDLIVRIEHRLMMHIGGTQWCPACHEEQLPSNNNMRHQDCDECGEDMALYYETEIA